MHFILRYAYCIIVQIKRVLHLMGGFVSHSSIQNLKSILVAILLLFISSFAIAGNFNVDGCFGCDNETYDVGFNVEFDVNGNPANGFLFLGQSGNTQYMYFQMPLEFVDTAYGDESLAHGWSNIRSFDKIIGSDRLIDFRFPNGGDEIQVDIDVLACIDECVKNKKSKVYDDSSNTYQSSGYEDWGGKNKSDGDDYGTDAAGFFSSIKTSMDYNVGLQGFNSLNSGATGSDAEKWVYHYGFEFEFKENVFAFGQNINGLSANSLSAYLQLGDSHASSAKDGPNTAPTTVGGRCDADCLPGPTNAPELTPVTEPTSIGIFGLGIIILALASRKRRLN